MEVVNSYRKAANQISENIYQLMWYMRGGLGRDDAFTMSYQEREIAWKLIKENLESFSKAGMAMY